MMGIKEDSLGTQLIADFESCIEQLLKDSGFAAPDAKEAAIKLVNEIQQRWGGVPLYFPTGHLRRLSERDQQIYDEFDGANYFALSKKYDKTERQIRNIVTKGRLLDQQRRQTDMFAVTEAAE